MSVNGIIELLDSDDEILESYVLIREIKMYFNIGHDLYHPHIKVKIFKSSIQGNMQYDFVVSHYVQTPDQAAPYHPSGTSFESEREAIQRAISTTSSFLKSAIRAGHEPKDSWLVSNDNF